MGHCAFLILYLHLGHWGMLWQFGIFEAEKEKEAHRAQEQRKDSKQKVRGSLLWG